MLFGKTCVREIGKVDLYLRYNDWLSFVSNPYYCLTHQGFKNLGGKVVESDIKSKKTPKK